MISKDEAILLLRAEGCSENVINHCINVSKYAREIAQKASKDFDMSKYKTVFISPVLVISAVLFIIGISLYAAQKDKKIQTPEQDKTDRVY